MTDLPDLVAFVRACLDEDERVARATLSVGTRANMQLGKPAPRWIRDGSRIRDDAPGPAILRVGHTWAREADHIARHDPARVLAEVAAKRAILELHAITVTKVATAPFDPDTGERREPEYEVECAVCGWVSDDPTSGCETIRLLAQSFAGRPGWREEWAT
jgi:hypothetical protein